MSKVLATGNMGFIGSHLMERLQQDGHWVSGCDIKNMIDIRTYNFHEKYDVIFHLAANASIPQSIENPIESHSHNVIGTLRILEYAKKIGAGIVFSSSSSVYGEPENTPTKETEPFKPMMPYALNKIECEQYLWLYWQLYGVKSVILRYFNVFGEGQENANGGGDSSLCLANFLRQYKEKKELTIVGDGEQRRDFIYVKDVVEANLKAAEYLDKAEQLEVFNIGSGINYSVNEVADMIKKERTYLPPRVEPKIGLADITKAKELLHWKPQIKLETWIKQQIGGGE